MSRPRTIPDADVFAAILQLVAAGGERAVAFSSVARATGLAAPSLVQRYTSLPGMIRAAWAAEWDRLEAVTDAALAEVDASGKGAQGLLKALATDTTAALLAASSRDEPLRRRARDWREKVEAALAQRVKSPETAAMLFAAWQGQQLWGGAGEKGFKLKDAIKRLS